MSMIRGRDKNKWELVYKTPGQVTTVEFVDIGEERGPFKLHLFMPDVGLDIPMAKRKKVAVDYIDLSSGGWIVKGISRGKQPGVGQSGYWLGVPKPRMLSLESLGSYLYVYRNKSSGSTILTDYRL